MRVWQTVPEFVKKSVFTWAEKKFSLPGFEYALHAAMPVASNSRTTRKFVQRLVLGTPALQNTGNVLLVLATAEFIRGSGESASSMSVISEPDHTLTSINRAATKADVERLQTDLAAMTTELKALRDTKHDSVVGADAYMAPIRFKDAVGRRYSFPWHICKTWKGMESLINQAFLHVDMIGAHVQEGHYDLVGPDHAIIMPQLWESVIRPDWEITMHLWPLPEPPRKEKNTKKTKPGDELYDPMIQTDNSVFAGVNLQDPFGMDHSAELAAKKKVKKDKSKAPTSGVAPTWDDYWPPPPAPPMASDPRPPKPAVVIELPPGLRETDLEKRVKEVNLDRTRRHSSRTAAKDKTDDRHTLPGVLEIDEGGDTPTQREDYRLVEEVMDLRRPVSADELHRVQSLRETRNAHGSVGQDEQLGPGIGLGSLHPGDLDATTRTNDSPVDFDDGHVLHEGSDTEDAMLDDEALKNKMLMKYAGVAAAGTAEPLVSGIQPISHVRDGTPY